MTHAWLCKADEDWVCMPHLTDQYGYARYKLLLKLLTLRQQMEASMLKKEKSFLQLCHVSCLWEKSLPMCVKRVTNNTRCITSHQVYSQCRLLGLSFYIGLSMSRSVSLLKRSIAAKRRLTLHMPSLRWQ